MRVPGPRWAWRRLRRIVRRRKPAGLILMYHRVAEGGTDPWGLCVAPRHFDEHLDVLKRTRRLLPLQKLAEAAARDRLPRGAVAITFDDGYADNALVARPLLERHDVPATVFVTTGSLGSDREFWWDELDRIFLQPGTLPRAFYLRLDGTEHAWMLGEAAEYDEAEAARHRGWRVWEAAPTPHHAIYLDLWERLYSLPDAEKQAVLDVLRDWAGIGTAARPSHRSLTPAEVAAMEDGVLIEIGAHTVTHPPLPTRPLDEQREEIRQSKADLERLLAHPVVSFAYPHGRHAPETVAEVRSAGFRVACTTVPEPVTASADPLTLPRMQVMDGDGEAFLRQLTAWQPLDR